MINCYEIIKTFRDENFKMSRCEGSFIEQSVLSFTLSSLHICKL